MPQLRADLPGMPSVPVVDHKQSHTGHRTGIVATTPPDVGTTSDSNHDQEDMRAP